MFALIAMVPAVTPVALPHDMKYLQDTLYVLNGKWKLLIILAVCSGHTRFRDIQRSIPGITSRMLSKELKELEMNKFITRTVYDEYPVRIAYANTAYCQSFGPVIQEMIAWGKQHHQTLRAPATEQLLALSEPHG